MNFIKEIPDIAQLLKESNYIDVKTVEGQTSLRQFIACDAVSLSRVDFVSLSHSCHSC